MNDGLKVTHRESDSKLDALLCEMRAVRARLEMIEAKITPASLEKTDRLTVKAAAAYLHISTRKLEDLIAQGKLVPIRPGGTGGKRWFTRQALDSHLKRSADR